MPSFWVSASWATCGVETDSQLQITEVCPIWRKFKGQHISRLIGWLRQNGQPVYVKVRSDDGSYEDYNGN